jgi:2-polyprenyl-3-methyl-5-hydroxy-6-metoxy-1,4-benzoquinol methylase
MCAASQIKADNAVDFFSQIAVEFDAKYQYHTNFKERYEVWTRTIAKYSNSNYRALDIGCGTGIFTVNLALRNRSAVGIDGSHEMINLCEKRRTQSDLTNIRFLNNDIRALKDTSLGKVDLVICSSVLEYIEDLDTSFELIRSLLENKGIFIFSIPNKSSFYRKVEPLIFKLTGWPAYYRFVRNVFTLPGIEAKLKQHGFILLDSAYYGQVPLASKMFRKFGLAKFLDTLFIVVAQRI